MNWRKGESEAWRTCNACDLGGIGGHEDPGELETCQKDEEDQEHLDDENDMSWRSWTAWRTLWDMGVGRPGGLGEPGAPRGRE